MLTPLPIRWGLIQTEDQLRFSVEAIVAGLRELAAPAPHTATHHTNGKRLMEAEAEEPDLDSDNSSAAAHNNPKKRKNSQS